MSSVVIGNFFIDTSEKVNFVNHSTINKITKIHYKFHKNYTMRPPFLKPNLCKN